MPFDICEFLCIRCVFDFCRCFHDIKKTTETGKTLLHHFHQFNQNLNRADKNSNVKSIHGQVSSLHFTAGNKISTIYQSNQIHHSLKEKIGTHETSHTTVIIPFGNKKSFIAFFKFRMLNIFIGKGLHNTDTGESILKTGIYITDLSPVFHKSFLHPGILPEREQKHQNNQNDQRKRQLFVDQE